MALWKTLSVYLNRFKYLGRFILNVESSLQSVHIQLLFINDALFADCAPVNVICEIFKRALYIKDTVA